MKYKHIFSVVIIGFLALALGFWKKILHKSGADVTITTSFIILGLSGVLALIKLLFLNKKDDFLNS